uniref:Uncharacterized protein n=1 Tax=Plectus sambesii TaxID=2011161 RepID=A0A914UMQ0_9BILA
MSRWGMTIRASIAPRLQPHNGPLAQERAMGRSVAFGDDQLAPSVVELLSFDDLRRCFYKNWWARRGAVTDPHDEGNLAEEKNQMTISSTVIGSERSFFSSI